MSEEIEIVLRRGPLKSKGYLWQAMLGDELLVEHRDPEFAACRLLHERGLTGRAIFRHEGSEQHSFRLDIERAAGLATQDDAKALRIKKHVPFDKGWLETGEEGI